MSCNGSGIMPGTGPLVAHAIHCYLSTSIRHDPASVLGIENVLLLLLAEVKNALRAGETADNAAGLDAALSVCRQIRTKAKSRGVRRWLVNNRGMLIDLAEEMAYALAKPDSPLQLTPIRPFFGHVLYHPVREPDGHGDLGEWSLEHILEPLPNFYIVRLLRPPFRIALLIDRLAHRCLTRFHN